MEICFVFLVLNYICLLFVCVLSHSDKLSANSVPPSGNMCALFGLELYIICHYLPHIGRNAVNFVYALILRHII